jgi:phenylacetic acid degradation operon negative regulatory protein
VSAVFPSISATRRAIQKWIQRALANDPPRAKSLVVTIFGDSIQPHGGSIRLKGLIDLLAPFGINQRLVRTSVFRLVREQWLQPKKCGRESSYQLTEPGRRRFALAYGKIYQRQTLQWNGRWTLLVLPANGTSPQLRTSLRRELEWQGVRQLTPNLFGHPQIDRAALAELLGRLNVSSKVVACQVLSSGDLDTLSLSDQVTDLWDLSAVSKSYRAFLRRCSTLRLLPGEPGVIPPLEWFMIRTLLIHAFRRIVLHDPLLPVELLPDPWIGDEAYALVGRIYWQSVPGSEAHLNAALGSSPNEEKAAGLQLRKRFRAISSKPRRIDPPKLKQG